MDFEPLPQLPMMADTASAPMPAALSAPGDPAGAPPPDLPVSDLDGRAKAAVVVRLLLNEGADLPLEELPEDLQAILTQQMAGMGLVNRATLASVAQEFADALDGVGLAFPRGMAGALSALDGKISAHTAARLRKEAGVREAGDPWERLRNLPIPELAQLVEAESTEVAAVLLSKLEVEKAASLLGALPGPLARRVTYAVSLTGEVTPKAVDQIGLSLAAQIDQRPQTAFVDGPDARVGAILNQSAASTRDDVLTSLDETDDIFATAVRKRIFTFPDIARRIKAKDIPAILREISQDQISIALAFVKTEEEQEARDFIFNSISSRMADNIRDEVDELGEVPEKDGDAAMTGFVAAIRRMELAGDIEFLPFEEATE